MNTIVALLLSLVMVVTTFITNTARDRFAYKEIKDLETSIMVNASIDAATYLMIEKSKGDNQNTSSEPLDFAVNPIIAADGFLSTMLSNLNRLDTPDNRAELMNNNIPCLVVLGFDGYYIITPGDSHSPYDVSLKRPYRYESKTGRTYALTMSPNVAYEVKNGKVGQALSKRDANVIGDYVPLLIHSEVTDSIRETIEKQRVTEGFRHFNVPYGLTGVNEIYGVGVIAVVQNLGYESQNFSSIGKTRIVSSRPVVCYVKDDSELLYSFVDKMPVDFKTNPRIKVIKYVNNFREAAEEGFAPNLKHL